MKNIRIVILVMIAALFTVNTYAQLEEDGVLFSMSLGTAIVKNKINDHSSNGYNLMVALEKMTMEGNSAIGFNFGIIRAEDKFNSGDSAVDYTITSHPALLSMRYMFGSEKFKGYAGVGLGIHISRLDLSDDIVDKITKPAANIPIGFMWIFNEGIYLNVNYAFNYLADSYFTNDLAHTFSLGIGIQLGK